MISPLHSMLLSFVSALVLAGAAAEPALAQSQAAAQRAGAPPVGIANPLAAHSLERLSATRERPLFAPTRRPPAPPPAPMASPPPPPPPPPNLALFGVIMDSEEARAIVRTGTGSEIRRVRIGDDIGGWKVTQIEGRRLVLSLDGRMATFSMFGGHGKAAPKAADKAPHPSPAPGTPIRLGRRGHED